MNIPDKIYANLSPAERIRAAVSALARNDDAELQTLKVTCPKKTYLMTDPAYSEGMERLTALALAVEFDLRTVALEFLLASRLNVSESAHDVVTEAIAEAAALDVAWRELLAEMGIPWVEMSEAGPPRHRAVKMILDLGEGEENAAEVQTWLEAFRARLAS
jgi:hypothetical protein